jgi:hypothetical protein
MKITIEYESAEEARDAMDSWKYQSIIRELLSDIRSNLRYSDPPLSKEIAETLEKIRARIYASAVDFSVSIE